MYIVIENNSSFALLLKIEYEYIRIVEKECKKGFLIPGIEFEKKYGTTTLYNTLIFI